MGKIKKAFLIFMAFIFVMLLVIINLDEIDEIHQIDYEKSGFQGLPFYSSIKVDPSTGKEIFYVLEGEIFPNDDISKSASVGEWNVNETIKQDLSTALRSEIKKRKIPIPRFRVQIIGYTYKNERYVWFNGFCFSFFDDTKHIWKEKYVSFLSRGLCTFEGLYHVETKKNDRFYWGSGENIKDTSD